MIKLFRKIRKQLDADNKPLKYFRYAFGEIVLVVIGILIAIQLNNCNEQRKTENQQTLLFIKLKEDLDIDLKYFDSLKTVYNQWYRQSEYIIDSILAGKVAELIKDEQYDVGRGSMNYLNINRSTYNELLNSGKLYEITNQELKKSINDYFQYVEIELIKLNSDNKVFFEVTSDKMEIEEFNRLFRLIEQRNLEYIDWSWLKDPKSREYKQFETRILYFRLAIKENQDVIAILMRKSNELIDQLDIELNKK